MKISTPIAKFPLFKDYESKEKFFAVVGMLYSRQITLSKAAELLNMDRDEFSMILKNKNFEYSYLTKDEATKELMKIYFEGKIIFLNDYKNLKVFGPRNFSLFTIYHLPFTKTQDKGHLNEIQEFTESIKSEDGYPIPLWQLLQATKISLEVEKQISSP